jgi:hypothetical protein
MWAKLKDQYQKLRSNKKRHEFKIKNPGFDPDKRWPQLETRQPAAQAKGEEEEREMSAEAIEKRKPACADCGHRHVAGACGCGCESHVQWTPQWARARTIEGEAWARAHPWQPPETVVRQETDFWPLPEAIDLSERACARRDYMAGRMLEWWRKKVLDAKGVPDWTLLRREESYRVVLAERRLSAELERYASAWEVPDEERGVRLVPPDSVLEANIIGAAVALYQAHKPLPARYRGRLDMPYLEYMDRLELYHLPPGYLLHQEQDTQDGGSRS